MSQQRPAGGRRGLSRAGDPVASTSSTRRATLTPQMFAGVRARIT